MELSELAGGLKVSKTCVGCWQFNDNKGAGTWKAQSYEVSKAIVDKAFELGLNFFDTAECYAGSEVTLGKCLQGRRQDAIIASKFGFREGITTPPYSPEQIDEAITASLEKLQTTYVDLMQVHCAHFLKDNKECVEELKRQIGRGRIRQYGLSNYGPNNLRSLFEHDTSAVSNQMSYNLLWRSLEHEVLPICREKGIGVLVYSPLQQGLLSGRFNTPEEVPGGRRRGKLYFGDRTKKSLHGQAGMEKEMFETLGRIRNICSKAGVPMSKTSLAWLLQQEGVASVIVGCRTPEQLEENSKIVNLSDDVVKQLTEATDELKAKLGKTLDQWVHPDRFD
ncbi:hypothetical protein ScPMuIL_015550 [Solemya velum]